MKVEDFIKEKRLLLDAKNLIENPDSWCQRMYACDKDGKEVNWDSQSARCRCLVGALFCAGLNASVHTKRDVHKRLEQIARYPELERFNDEYTHVEVIELLNRAIAEIDLKVKEKSS